MRTTSRSFRQTSDRNLNAIPSSSTSARASDRAEGGGDEVGGDTDDAPVESDESGGASAADGVAGDQVGGDADDVGGGEDLYRAADASGIEDDEIDLGDGADAGGVGDDEVCGDAVDVGGDRDEVLAGAAGDGSSVREDSGARNAGVDAESFTGPVDWGCAGTVSTAS